MTNGPITPTSARPVSRAPQEALNEAQELQRIFGENVRAARIRLGMTQEDLSARSGTARSYVGAVEAGRQNLTLETLLRSPAP